LTTGTLPPHPSEARWRAYGKLQTTCRGSKKHQKGCGRGKKKENNCSPAHVGPHRTWKAGSQSRKAQTAEFERGVTWLASSIFVANKKRIS
jgi:hypothetical protein